MRYTAVAMNIELFVVSELLFMMCLEKKCALLIDELCVVFGVIDIIDVVLGVMFVCVIVWLNE